jgi:hypothetical protein
LTFDRAIFATGKGNVHLAGKGAVITAPVSGLKCLYKILMIFACVFKRPDRSQIAPGPIVYEPIVGFIRHSIKIGPDPVCLFKNMIA